MEKKEKKRISLPIQLVVYYDIHNIHDYAQLHNEFWFIWEKLKKEINAYIFNGQLFFSNKKKTYKLCDSKINLKLQKQLCEGSLIENIDINLNIGKRDSFSIDQILKSNGIVDLSLFIIKKLITFIQKKWPKTGFVFYWLKFKKEYLVLRNNGEKIIRKSWYLTSDERQIIVRTKVFNHEDLEWIERNFISKEFAKPFPSALIKNKKHDESVERFNVLSSLIEREILFINLERR